jgi:hypothetical protein
MAMELAVGFLLGLVAVLGITLAVFVLRSKSRDAQVRVEGGSILGIQRVGELVVLRVNWAAPAVGADHVFGEVGRRFLRWLWSENKTIMIFRFEIRFKFDLRDPSSVRLAAPTPETLEVRLGRPAHDISLSEVRFYHTEKGQLLDWLLPRALNIFTSEMEDSTRQQILDAAKENARKEAEELASKLAADAVESAKTTLTALGRSAGFSEVRFAQEEAAAAAVAKEG